MTRSHPHHHPYSILLTNIMTTASKSPSDGRYVFNIQPLASDRTHLSPPVYRPAVNLTADERKQIKNHGRWLRRVCQPFDSFESILSVWLNSQEGSQRLAQPNAREYYTSLQVPASTPRHTPLTVRNFQIRSPTHFPNRGREHDHHPPPIHCSSHSVAHRDCGRDCRDRTNGKVESAAPIIQVQG